jgi:fatty-acyl-CoA synthase
MRWLDRTFADALAWAAREHGPSPAFICDGRHCSYAELAARADAFAAGLLASGIGAGDKVGLWLPDSLEWIVARWAIPSIGAILVPINTRFRDVDLRYVLEQSECSALIMRARHRNVDFCRILGDATGGWVGPLPGAPAPQAMPHLKTTIGVGDDLPPGMAAFDEILRRGADCAASDLVAVRRKIAPADIAQILYTSGTKSFPKGAMVRHGALLENNFNNAARMQFGPSDRFLASAPLFSATGTSYALYTFLSGGAVVVGDGFTAESFAGSSSRSVSPRRSSSSRWSTTCACSPGGGTTRWKACAPAPARRSRPRRSAGSSRSWASPDSPRPTGYRSHRTRWRAVRWTSRSKTASRPADCRCRASRSGSTT